MAQLNYKRFCSRLTCTYAHACIKCKVAHPACTCGIIWSRETWIPTVPTMRPNQHHFSRWDMGITVQMWYQGHFNWPDHLSLMLLAHNRECWDYSFQGHILPQCLIFGPKLDLWALGRTPINVLKLQELLLEYPKKSHATFLSEGFQSGFKLNFDGPRLPIDCNNLKSIKDNPEIAKETILHEVKLGRIAGPFTTKPILYMRCSQTGLVARKRVVIDW